VRRYIIEVPFDDFALKELRLTAKLNCPSLSNVLTVITASVGMDYSDENLKRKTSP